MADYIIQKAVNAAAVLKKQQRSMEYYGQAFDAYRKYDGCCAILKDGQTLSRTGEVYQCLDEVANDRTWSNRGLIPIGEAWWPGKDQFSLISGDFRRHARSPRMQFKVFDLILREEFAAGYSDVPFATRFQRAGAASGHRWALADGWVAGSYGAPQALCNRLVNEGGFDGLILRDPNGTWTRGSGTTGEIVKIKRVLSLDLRVLEVSSKPGPKTGRPVYTIVVDYKGKRLGVGSGVPHAFEDVPTVGQIVEVEAMDESSKGLLREPRFKSIRFDKLEPDTL